MDSKKIKKNKMEIKSLNLTNVAKSEIKGSNNILLGRDDNTLSPSLLSVEYCVLHFPNEPLVHTQYNRSQLNGNRSIT